LKHPQFANRETRGADPNRGESNGSGRAFVAEGVRGSDVTRMVKTLVLEMRGFPRSRGYFGGAAGCPGTAEASL
jgi:hypothetical protein